MLNNTQNLAVSDTDLLSTAAEGTSIIFKLLPIIGVVFVAYLIIGLAMSVLPLHVHERLGFSTFIVGLVAGSQFAAALFSRPWAGFFADKEGAKRTVITGLIIAVVSGALYLFSLQFAAPLTSLIILFAGRIALGIAESFIITGALSWGLARAGVENTGKTMSWIGTALYAAYAVGAPAGTWAYAKEGFTAIAIAATVIPFITLFLVSPLRRTEPIVTISARPSLMSILRLVWMPGLGLAVSGVGFGAITTFIVLLFVQNTWENAWLALTLLSIAFIVGRIFFGHLPDKNGAKAALICILIEAAGLALIWLAPSGLFALIGVTLVGLGYSLVYPGFGVEALRRTPPENRGLAMGAYTAFLDVSLGFASPALGLIANRAGLNAVFLVSTLVVLGSALIALRLLLSSKAKIIPEN